MQSTQKLFRILGIILFCAGVLAGMVMFILMNWAYFEASFYFGYSAPADKTLTNLRSPLVMTTSDTGEVTMSVTNTTKTGLSIRVQTELSYYGAVTLDKTSYTVPAGETRKLSWPVSWDNLVFGHLVMARVYQFSAYTLPSRTNTCGTVMVALPGVTGMQVFISMLVFSLFGLAAGWGLWLASLRPLQGGEIIATRAMIFMTIIVVLGILGGIIGWWGLGLICAAGGVLLMISVTGYYLQKT
jgi:hypothetical protein